ncbi:MAG: hypothetical protein DMD82_03400 [Candidatus Rokuibacteriota bacterium]|nr:MAG: hypothetical protein DMD82_03400 [Candidatus Rokubacteria bacterium]
MSMITGLDVPARRISRWVCDRLAYDRPRGAAITSLYGGVANLRLDSGELVCIGAMEIPLSPNGLSIDLPDGLTFFDLGLRIGQAATCVSDALSFSEARLRVRLAGAARWEPRPTTAGVSPRELARSACEARALAVAEGACGSLLPLLWAHEGIVAVPEPARRAALPAITLGRGAVAGERRAVARAAGRLAGLGPGLTPSGDDYLAGFAAAWALVSEALGLDSWRVRLVLEALRAGADPGASELGRAWISHATRGEVAEPMARFFTALLGTRPDALAVSARGVLRLGATSGTDWLVGALAGVAASLVAIQTDRSWN